MSENIFYLILAGVVSGVIGGMGMGGGTLLIPILTLFLGFAQKSAQGVNLIVFIPMSLLALIIHIKNKLVDFKVGVPIVCTGVVFSILGSILSNSLSNDFMKKMFGGFLILVGVYQVVNAILALKKSKQGKKGSFKFKIMIN